MITYSTKAVYDETNSLIVLIESIVEVREGQNSDGFDRYPFEEAEDQSFSLLVEGEIQGTYTGYTYTYNGCNKFIT